MERKKETGTGIVVSLLVKRNKKKKKKIRVGKTLVGEEN